MNSAPARPEGPDEAGQRPGWYPDATYDHLERWWTGERWTADIREKKVQATKPSLQSLQDQLLARPGERFLAWFIDEVCISVIAYAVSFPAVARMTHLILNYMRSAMLTTPKASDVPTMPLVDAMWLGLAGFAVAMLWYFLWGRLAGRTPGQMALGLRFAKATMIEEYHLDWNTAGMRAFTAALLRSAGSIDLLFVLLQLMSASLVWRHPLRQSWPDIFARTLVVRTGRNIVA